MTTTITEPNTVRVWIDVDRGAAIRAGRGQYGRVLVELDPAPLTDEQRAEVADHLHTVAYRSGAEYRGGDLTEASRLVGAKQERRSITVPDASIESIAAAIDAHRRHRLELDAEAQAETERRRRADEDAIAAWLAVPDEELLREPCHSYDSWTVRAPDIHGRLADHPEAAQRMDRLRDIAEERRHSAAAAARARTARETARREARQARREAQIAAWVAEHGDENQQARHAEGLLPEDEAVAGIRRQTFACLDNVTRYERITAAEVRAACDDDDAAAYDTPQFATVEAGSLDAEEYETLRAIRERLRAAGVDAECQPREHRGWLDDDEPDGHVVRRRSVLVTATVGELTLSREYAL